MTPEYASGVHTRRKQSRDRVLFPVENPALTVDGNTPCGTGDPRHATHRVERRLFHRDCVADPGGTKTRAGT